MEDLEQIVNLPHRLARTIRKRMELYAKNPQVFKQIADKTYAFYQRTIELFPLKQLKPPEVQSEMQRIEQLYARFRN